ncbi:peptide methionine sulfoxide reductase [Acrasis kona]|uniref:Peptide methionine sulfoxide reductase n=1 Tax=Acrasis kona TaxID=1008807 RepID=A0AAW2YUI3_9EUKA
MRSSLSLIVLCAVMPLVLSFDLSPTQSLSYDLHVNVGYNFKIECRGLCSVFLLSPEDYSLLVKNRDFQYYPAYSKLEFVGVHSVDNLRPHIALTLAVVNKSHQTIWISPSVTEVTTRPSKPSDNPQQSPSEQPQDSDDTGVIEYIVRNYGRYAIVLLIVPIIMVCCCCIAFIFCIKHCCTGAPPSAPTILVVSSPQPTSVELQESPIMTKESAPVVYADEVPLDEILNSSEPLQRMDA